MDPRRPTVLQHELIPTTPSAGPSGEHVLPAVKRESLPNASQLKWLGPWDRVKLALRCARRIFDPVYQPPTPLKTEKTLEHVEMRQKFEQVFQEIEQAADAKTALNEEGAATALKEKINDATPPNNKALAASAQALRWIVDATKTPDNDDQASWLETAIKATEKAIRLLGANGDEFRAFVRVEYNRLSRRPDDTERDSSGSTTEEYRGTIDASIPTSASPSPRYTPAPVPEQPLNVVPAETQRTHDDIAIEEAIVRLRDHLQTVIASHDPAYHATVSQAMREPFLEVISLVRQLDRNSPKRENATEGGQGVTTPTKDLSEIPSITVEEAAARLKIKPDTVRDYIEKGRFGPVESIPDKYKYLLTEKQFSKFISHPRKPGRPKKSKKTDPLS